MTTPGYLRTINSIKTNIILVTVDQFINLELWNQSLRWYFKNKIELYYLKNESMNNK